jgi:hypothetical protein
MLKYILFLVLLSTVMALPGYPLLAGVPSSKDTLNNTTAETAKVTIGYTRVGGHAPGNYSITIQGREAAIVTPDLAPITSRVPVAEDEVEHFLALLRLGDFFNRPTSSPQTGRIIEDRPTETLTLTVDGKSHMADCTDTHDPYLGDFVGLFREILRKQETILVLEAAVMAKTSPSEPLARYLRWKMPLRGQRDKANELINELMEQNPVHEIVYCDASGNIDTLSALSNSSTIEILTAKLKASDPDLYNAVDALGSSGDQRAIPPLLNLLAEGNRDTRIIRALARLDCHAVLEEALEQRNIEALGYIGRDDPRAIALVEGEAYGWFTERWPRLVAVQALTQMQRLPTPTKANLFAHVFAGLLILLGIGGLISPCSAAKISDQLHSPWLRAIAIGVILAGLGILYMLHFAIFF